MAVLNQIGSEKLTVGTGAVGLTPRSPTGAAIRPRRALIHVGGQPIRWQADGTPVDGTTGQPVEAGGRINWTGDGELDQEYDAWGLIMNVKFARDAAALADAVLNVAYFT